MICSDVLHYVSAREFNQGLPGLAELCAGVAFLETFAQEDAFEGDHDGFQPRPARWYRKRFASAGFTALGSHCWLSPQLLDAASALEHSSPGGRGACHRPQPH